MTELFAGTPELANEFSLPMLAGESGYVIERKSGVLQLRDTSANAPGPLFVDFDSKENQRRVKVGLQYPLVRAVGVANGQPSPFVVDATAGLGRDAYVLASSGCNVLAIERSPIVAALLIDGVRRSGTLAAKRIQVRVGEAMEIITALPKRPDVIYLDPMFPARRKSALVKKEMQYFQALLGNAENVKDLLEFSLGIAGQRVVLKRPAGTRLAGSVKPNHVLEGKTVNFEVYLASAS